MGGTCVICENLVLQFCPLRVLHTVEPQFNKGPWNWQNLFAYCMLMANINIDVTRLGYFGLTLIFEVSS